MYDVCANARKLAKCTESAKSVEIIGVEDKWFLDENKMIVTNGKFFYVW